MPVPLARVLADLEVIAPLRLAAAWDNVGLLVEPRRLARQVHRILLTIDCTPLVVAEALAQGSELIVSYHPPIFAGLKRLCAREPRTAALLEAAAAGIAIYSPHTALDAVPGGVNDWLSEAFPGASASVLEPSPGGPEGAGQGRRLRLARPTALATIVARVKAHLGVRQLRAARGSRRRRAVREVALVPGAGGELLVAAARARALDLVVTGELRHHDVLAINEAGCDVLLAEHSSSERGYLPRLRAALRARLGSGVRVTIARSDREPLQPV